VSSYELDIAGSLGSGDLAKEYVRMRKQWSHEFSMEFVRVYRKISRLEEEVGMLQQELDRLRAQETHISRNHRQRRAQTLIWARRRSTRSGSPLPSISRPVVHSCDPVQL